MASKSNIDDIRQSQLDELEVIKAIYVGDVSEKASNIDGSSSLQFSVRLLPQRGSSSGGGTGDGGVKLPTFVNLHFKIPTKYPNRLPLVTFGEHKGLSSTEILELESELKELAQQSLGEVMIYQLLTHAEAYLYTHQKLQKGSFHDEMILRQKQLEEQSIQLQINTKEKERLMIREEILRKQDEMREELRRVKEQRKLHLTQSAAQSQSVGGGGTGSVSDLSESASSPSNSPLKEHAFPISTTALPKRIGSRRRSSAGHAHGRRLTRCNSEGSDSSFSESQPQDLTLIEFNSGKTTNLYHRGQVIGRSDRGSTVYAGMSRTGNLVAIKEWKFVAKLDKKGKELKPIASGVTDPLTLQLVEKQLSLFENEMNLLQKLEQENIVLYFGLKVFSPVDEPGVLYVLIAEEFVRGTTLHSYMQGTLALDLALVRHCAKGMLQGLKFLHDNDIVHRFLRDSSVFLDTSGQIKLSDYGVERKICELFTQWTKQDQNQKEILDLDKFPPSIGRGGKKGDIYRFGCVILSLIKGAYVSNPPEIPPSLPQPLQDFLKKCLTPIEHSRASAAELLDHDFLKLPLQSAPVLPLRNGNDKNGEMEMDMEDQSQGQGQQERKKECQECQEDELSDESALDLSKLFKGHCRVESEFELLKWLGKGGFGDVLKVRNKLDGRIYALKRIRLNPRNTQLNKKITREVKLLSQLNHENVVRYFNSWIETVIESEDEASSTEPPSSATNANSTSVSAAFNGNGKKPLPLNFKPSPNPHQVRFLQNNPMKRNFQNSLGVLDDIEAMAPSMGNAADSEWSVSLSHAGGGAGGGGNGRQSSLSDDSDESSDDDLFGTSFRRITVEDSDDVLFAKDSNDGEDEKERSGSSSCELETGSSKSINKGKENGERKAAESDSCVSISGFVNETQFMYIQMEFCEKSTLRTAIDSNLCEDLDRAWRLFREIVEGLVHIHQQGMIHRDLKPVNIFLDSHDHVKIGDFGLATSSIIPKRNEESTSILVQDLDHAQSLDFADESRTGQVGTALYVAPELIVPGPKISYNQKVDIYSLGIMFFEMFYHPPSTGMERVRVIMGLRQAPPSGPLFPKDFDTSLLPQVTHITKWLLNHDHRQRPTSLELLQSDYLPPPHLEEAELRDIFSRTLRTSKTKAYKYLVASCFSQQPCDSVEDAMYDIDMTPTPIMSSTPSASISISNISRPLHFVQKVKQVIRHVFERHSAVELLTPLLLPKSEADIYSQVDSCVNVMCHSGSIQTLPHDLRIPFARYVGRQGITNLKRFAIDKVFRERKVYGLHPRELIECAFDIIDVAQGQGQGSLIADAETISVVFEILQQLPWMASKIAKGCTVRLGHTKLLQGVMMHYGLDVETQAQIIHILAGLKNERDSKSLMQTHLVSLGLSENVMQMLITLMEVEGSFPKISNILKGLMKRKGSASSAIKEALHDLEILIANLLSFGIKCNIVLAPAMAFGGNIYSGLLFQVVCDLKRRKNRMMVDVIAAGGRYDELLQTYRGTLCLEAESKDLLVDQVPCGVGISISLDKLLLGYESSELGEVDEDWSGCQWGGKGAVDTIICSVGQNPMAKEKIEFLNELLSQGVRTMLLEGSQTLESAEAFCKSSGAIFLVIIKQGEYFSNLRVRRWDRERGRFNEKTLPKQKVIELITRTMLELSPSESTLHASGSSSCLLHHLHRSDSLPISSKPLLCSEVNCTSGVAHQHHVASSHPGLPPYSISFILQERDKLTHLKRRYENQVMSRIPEILSKLNRQHSVDILGIEVNVSVINNIAAHLSHQDKDEFSKAVNDLFDKHIRLKKYLKSICDELYELLYEKCTVIIIYGLNDNSYRALL